MTQAPTEPGFGDLAQDAVDLARRWLAEAARAEPDPVEERFARVLADPNGAEFVTGLLDGVVRPQDLFAAGYNLQRVAKLTPDFLPWRMRMMLAVCGVLGPVIPGVVVPLARRTVRRFTAHLVLDAAPEDLADNLRRLRDDGARVDLNLPGPAAVGEVEAREHFDAVYALLERDDVDRISFPVESIAANLNLWSFDDTVARVIKRVAPLFALAAGPTPKHITLEAGPLATRDLTIAVFRGILGQPKYRALEAGIVLQAYLPDADATLHELTRWAIERKAGGGAPIAVRIVKGAHLAQERADAALHGWAVAASENRQSTDATFKRMLDHALTVERTGSVRVGVASQNLFDLAFAWLLAVRRGVESGVDFELLLGVSAAQAEAVRQSVGAVTLYTPVAAPDEFDSAVPYLVRLVAEYANPQSCLSTTAAGAAGHGEFFERERGRFLASIDELVDQEQNPPRPNRTQDRSTQWQDGGPDDFFRPRHDATGGPGRHDATDTKALDESLTGVVLGLERGSLRPAEAARPDVLNDFRNEPDTDPALAANRAWARRVVGRVAASEEGVETYAAAKVSDDAVLDHVIETVGAHGVQWGARSGFDRAATLDRAGIAIAANRDRLIEVLVAETGQMLADADTEVSRTVDLARWYAARARELDSIQGAKLVPRALTVVATAADAPLAGPAEGTLAALAAGSGVILDPDARAGRSAAVLCEALWEAGVERQLVALVDLHDWPGQSDGRPQARSAPGDGIAALATKLPSAGAQIVMTGEHNAVARLYALRPQVALTATTRSKNVIIVTPYADEDRAIADIVASAFGRAGQDAHAAGLVILVGAARSWERFLRRLADAVTSIRAGYPGDPAATMGPLIEPPTGKLLHALTTLGAGEEWLVEPKRRSDDGRLWSPGVRTSVQPGSYAHLTEFFGPVLAVMRARTLEQAIRYQNAIDHGLAGGLQSFDAAELAQWVDTTEAGNLFANRPITGSMVQRQPDGGWRRSAIGAAAFSGGPNRVISLGDWLPDESKQSKSLHLRGLDPRVTDLIESGQSAMDYTAFDLVRRSALSDAIAWAAEFGQLHDVAALGIERNLLRYRPAPVAVRLAESGTVPQLLRVLAAATLARAPITVSSAQKLPAGIRAVLRVRDIALAVHSDAQWLARVASGGPGASRVRLIGGDRRELADSMHGDPDVAVYAGEVTPSGRVELLPFLAEQTVSITTHRRGVPDRYSDTVI